MKEININIEGYNVNGICVGCLNYNRRMHYDNDIKVCFKLLGEIDISDGLEVQLCWECLAYVKKTLNFRQQILKSFDFLIKYSQEKTFLDSPDDFKHHTTTKLSVVCFQNVECPPNYTIDKEEIEFGVKEETEGEENFVFDVPIKEETEDILHDTAFEDLPSAHDATSEDDIQLSLLKDRTVKVKKKRKKKDLEENDVTDDSNKNKTDRVKKRKTKKKEIEVTPEPEIQPIEKTNRKLKNLPEDMVELYTMTEKEMWAIRDEDRESKEFLKLKFKCDDCIKGFNTEKLKNDHFNGKHQEKGENCHQCEVCQAYFLTKDNVASHRALHLAAYKCILCNLKTTLKIRMLKHVTQHRDIQQHMCDTCGGKFSTKSKLSYHRSICRQERPQCDCCGKVFANKMTLKYHLKILPHNKEEKPKETLYIPCKGCDKVFHSKKSYRAHVVIHDGLTYPCPTCGKLFQWKRNLARHTRNHREREAGALHECRACGKSFASRDCYNNHMRMSKRHVPEDAYQHECTYCSKKFPTKWCLTDHIDWDHLKRIKYQCSVCFKPFKTAKIMVAHVNNIHEGKKKEAEGEHLCEICGKSYKTVKRLKGHVWAMHTKRSNTKSYKCKLCPATFTWQTSIYKHMKMMHDTNKKTKPSRPVPPVKKEEPYPGIDLANHMQYLNMVHIQPLGVNQNLV
ncbi:unnamed protein product [Arctia plantaginis]|uniref:C2H2-type domain-containing protein n=1 Tax=Arctia plantaginis TaxID=874455 RepID=A0A8S1BIE4_ARCPL|nr:unnamed protein product [Arctia plantaginis]